MQALALQFNLSETTFLLPSERAAARIRIFTPTFEMPFAGHPTLGSAHVVRALGRGSDEHALETGAGVIAVRADGDVWTLGARPPRHRTPRASSAELCGMLGLAAEDLAGPPLWVDTGSEQLVIPLLSADAVHRARPRGEARARLADGEGRALAYVFAREGDRVEARFFFMKHGAVIEDPGTGSACANLGGWLLATGVAGPTRLTVSQGAAVGRPCRLGLAVSAEGGIEVSGRVIEIGRGTVGL
jgi:PhzF family phenazine biosynthesis protein